jgi:uncharacterized membrane protein YfcA
MAVLDQVRHEANQPAHYAMRAAAVGVSVVAGAIVGISVADLGNAVLRALLVVVVLLLGVREIHKRQS